MIGIIVSGHGHFATGLVSALKLLAGEPEALETVDFEAEDSIERLEEKQRAAISALADAEGILLMTDLRGGSPFNVAARLAMENSALEVVTGSSLPMLVEAYMSRQMFPSAAELAVSVAETGKNQAGYFEKSGMAASGDDDDEIELD